MRKETAWINDMATAQSLCYSAVVDTAVSENRCSWLLVCWCPLGLAYQRVTGCKEANINSLTASDGGRKKCCWNLWCCCRVLCWVSTGVTITVMLPWQVSAGLTRSPVLEGVEDPLCSSEVEVASGKNWKDNTGKWRHLIEKNFFSSLGGINFAVKFIICVINSRVCSW